MSSSFLEMVGLYYTRFEENVGQSLALLRSHVLDFQHIALFWNQKASEADFLPT